MIKHQKLEAFGRHNDLERLASAFSSTVPHSPYGDELDGDFQGSTGYGGQPSSLTCLFLSTGSVSVQTVLKLSIEMPDIQFRFIDCDHEAELADEYWFVDGEMSQRGIDYEGCVEIEFGNLAAAVNSRNVCHLHDAAPLRSLLKRAAPLWNSLLDPDDEQELMLIGKVAECGYYH